MILGNLAQYKYDTNERMSACSWIILQYGDQFYLKNPCICFIDVTYFENWVFQQSIAKPKILKANKSWQFLEMPN